MNLWEARIAEKIVTTYNIETQEDIQKLITLIKARKSEESILASFNLDPTQVTASKYSMIQPTTKTVLDERFARTIWMKWVYCEYPSFSDDAECRFCGRRRKDWYRQPCLYYLAKWNEQQSLINK